MNASRPTRARATRNTPKLIRSTAMQNFPFTTRDWQSFPPAGPAQAVSQSLDTIRPGEEYIFHQDSLEWALPLRGGFSAEAMA